MSARARGDSSSGGERPRQCDEKRRHDDNRIDARRTTISTKRAEVIGEEDGEHRHDKDQSERASEGRGEGTTRLGEPVVGMLEAVGGDERGTVRAERERERKSGARAVVGWWWKSEGA